MDVTADSQARYRVTDENGKVHYVECFMCAMQLVNDYENFILKPTATGMDETMQSLSTHRIMGQKSLLIYQQLFFSGRKLCNARVAYNQTAADDLANGFSQYISPERQYKLRATTEVKQIIEAINTWYA